MAKKKLTEKEKKELLLKSIHDILIDEKVEAKEVKKRVNQLKRKSYKAIDEAYENFLKKSEERRNRIFIPPAPGADEETSERVKLQMKLDELRNYNSDGLISFARDILRYHVDPRQCKGDIFRAVAYKVQEFMGLGDAPRVRERQASLEDPKNIQKSINRKEEEKEMTTKKNAAKKAANPSKLKKERGPSYQDKLRELFKKKSTHLSKEDIAKEIGSDMQNTGTAISFLKNPKRCGKGEAMELVLCKITKLYYRADGVAPKLTKEQKEAAKAPAKKAAPAKKETKKAPAKKETKKPATKKPAAKGGAGSKKK